MEDIGHTGAARRWLGQRGLALGAAVVLVVGAVLLYRFEPNDRSAYPRCLLHSLTGLHCPGCGTTRCLHALLHGDVRQAAAYNVLTLIFLPPLLVWAGRSWLAVLLDLPAPRRRLPGWFVWLLLVSLVAFGVLRNLPFAPFTLLAPHTL